MIIKVEFKAKRNFPNEVILFGNSYKPWQQQFEEYTHLFSHKFTDITTVQKSNARWIGWGGLKWCPESQFQHKLNREGCQQGDPDNPAPRSYANMWFVDAPKELRYAKTYLSKVKSRSQ